MESAIRREDERYNDRFGAKGLFQMSSIEEVESTFLTSGGAKHNR